MDSGRGWCRSGPRQVTPVAGDAERGQGLALGDEVLGKGRAAGVSSAWLSCRTAGGRWVLTGGGGYALVQVVPRAWTHLLAGTAGQPVDPRAQTPPAWREYAGMDDRLASRRVPAVPGRL